MHRYDVQGNRSVRWKGERRPREVKEVEENVQCEECTKICKNR